MRGRTVPARQLDPPVGLTSVVIIVERYNAHIQTMTDRKEGRPGKEEEDTEEGAECWAEGVCVHRKGRGGWQRR